MSRLRELRIRSGYSTATDAAAALGVPPSTYTPYERNGKNPPIWLGLKMSDIFNASLDQIYGRAPVDDSLVGDELDLVKTYNRLGPGNKMRLAMYLEYLGYLEEKEKELIG